jgi:peptidoglycan/LPS O-acetylase OafA/YrhL
MQCYLLLPYIKSYCTKQGTILLAAVSLLSVLLMNIFYQRFTMLPFGFVSTLGWATHWLGFFATGIYLANFSSREYKLRLPIGILLAGLFLSFFETQIWPETMGERIGYRISAFIYSYGVILLLFSRRIEMLFLNSNSIVGKIISYIGVISFGIYLIHYKLIEFVPVDNWLVKWFVTLFVSILFIVVTKRLFPKFAKKYLGFY